MKIRNLLISALIGLLFLGAVGCKKDVAYDSLLILKGWTQQTSGGDLVPMHEVAIYGYQTDTALYAPANYEDALLGRLTSKQDPSIQLDPATDGTAYDLTGFGLTEAMQVQGISHLYLLVVNPVDRLYAYTMLQMAENLPHLYISYIFKLWNVGRVKKDGAWMVFNDFYVPDITCIVRSYLQAEEGGEPSNLKNSKIFAYAVEDPEAWLPQDYTSAETGRLTNPATGEVVDFSYSFSADSQGVFSLSLPPRDYLLMLFNAANRSCALYTFRESDTELAVTLAPWRTEYPYTDEAGWTHYYFPEEIEEPENPEDSENPDETIPTPEN